MSERIKILVVDDSNLIRFKVKSIFEEFDVEILELNNAEELFRFSKRFQKVNLIILDVTLPNLSGIDALEKMHLDKVWAYIPVIMLTSKTDRVTVQKALKAGAVNYIRKPFTDDEVLERVEKVLGPLPLAGNNEAIWSDDEIKKQMSCEMERARRGDYPISFVKINPPGIVDNPLDLQELVRLRDNVSKELRKVDMSFISSKRNLVLILPFTNSKGATLVIKKIYSKYTFDENKKIEPSILTFPDNCNSEKELLSIFRL